MINTKQYIVVDRYVQHSYRLVNACELTVSKFVNIDLWTIHVTQLNVSKNWENEITDGTLLDFKWDIQYLTLGLDINYSSQSGD